MTKQDPDKLKKVFVNLFGIGSAEWQDHPPHAPAFLESFSRHTSE
jgi:hypothetical protein